MTATLQSVAQQIAHGTRLLTNAAESGLGKPVHFELLSGLTSQLPVNLTSQHVKLQNLTLSTDHAVRSGHRECGR